MRRRGGWVFGLALLVLGGVLALWLPAAVPPESVETAAVAARIAQVENGLLPAIVLKGQPVAPMKLTDRMAHYRVPGVSIAVIHNGELDWARGYGVAEAGSGQAVSAATLFQAASISKPVAALGALRLVEQGRLALDENVNGKLRTWKVPDNGYTAQEKVTLRRLVSHSAGLTVHGFPGYAAGEPLPTVRQILDGEKPANTDPVRVDILPGSRWRYSGGGYTVLQQLLEDVTGTPFPALLRELVLDPLGMKHSTYEQPLPPARARTAATGHRASGEPVKGKWHTYPEMAAAGLWTTPSDLARFAMAIQQAYAGTSNSVLSRAMARQLLTTQIDGWGLGPGVEGEGRSARFSHGGDNRGFKCYLVAYRDTGQGAVVMTNGDNGADLAQEIIRSIARVYGWPDYAPKEKILARVEPERLAEYKGRYNGRFPLLLTREQDRLWMGWDDIDRRYELLPEADDRFFVVENGMEITFSRDADGRVEGLNLHIYGLTLQSKKLP